MSKEMIIATSPHETKVALLEDGQVVELHVEREKELGLVGSIYKGRVTRVLPGMQSAFVDIGLDRDAFLYVSDFIEDLEDYERVALPPEPEEPPTENEVEAQPEAPPAPPEAQPVEEQPPVEERQPDFVSAQPPLQLPERRPRGRSRYRHRRPHRRSGRDRYRPDRGRRPEGQRPRRDDRQPLEPQMPVILPGESLAKYRDLTPPQPTEPESAEPAREGRLEPPAPGAFPEENSNGPNQPPDETPAREDQVTPEETAEKSVAQPAAEQEEAEVPQPAPVPEETAGESAVQPGAQHREEPVFAEPTPVAQEPTPEENAAVPAPAPEPAPAPVSVEGSAETEKVESAEPPANDFTEPPSIAEIERVRRYEDEVGLPPSLQERTAGGVEWQRTPGAGRRGRHRRHRHRRPRGRARQDRRPGTGRRLHARPSRGQPPIAQLLRAGQEIIVQIAKEQMGKKGARITSHVTLPGRFLVYMPTIDHIGISRKIGTSEERNRLRRLLLDLKASISGGFVVRTAAAGCSEEDLHQDIDYLVKLWHDLRARAEETPAPTLLHRDLNLVERILRDYLTTDYENVWVDSEEEYAKVVEFVARIQPDLASRVKLYTKSAPIFEETGVQQEIERALRPKVWLKSGGYIVINHTEALVAIDVNTGKFVGKGSTRLEDTIVKTNLEAVKEIVRQIRLRDLGGIIIIDFIDMEDRRNRQRVMRALEDALRSDRAPSKLLAFNEFGLVAITRKRSRLSLERVLCQPCPYCTGTGMVKSIPTLCYEIQGEAKKMAEEMDAPELTIRAHPEIVKALKGRDSSLVRELEEQTGKNIILQSDTTLHFEQYNIY